jgi:pantoate--beta-alanine ligase
MKRKKSTHRPRVIKTLPALKRAVGDLRKKSKTIALVPTMGALHAGHLELIRIAQRRADRVIVSIFVNPTQFAPTEDLGAYPRTFAADLAALAKMKADLVWAPSVAMMYPEGFAMRIALEGAAKAGLEDAFRPHFFGGVATVVAKLFIQCEADFALFGEKDYQQLNVVTRLVRDLGLRTRIVAVPTVRDKDGLALSSRNAYLSPPERAAAPVLYRVLKECAAAIRAGKPVEEALSRGREAISSAGFALDYLEARNADTLSPLGGSKSEPIRLLVAAKIGKTRLIDNIGV